MVLPRAVSQPRSRSRRSSSLKRSPGATGWPYGAYHRGVDPRAQKPNDARRAFFSGATPAGEVGELARRYTHFPARFEGELPADRRSGDVDHRFVAVTPDNKVSTLVDLLKQDECGLALVFVRTKAGADRLVEKLLRHDVDAAAIHGDKGQAQ